MLPGRRARRTIHLRSGGSVTITDDFDLFDLDEGDRRFVSSLADAVSSYQDNGTDQGRRGGAPRPQRVTNYWTATAFVFVLALAVPAPVPFGERGVDPQEDRFTTEGVLGDQPPTQVAGDPQSAAAEPDASHRADLSPIALQAYEEAALQAGVQHPGCAVRPAILAGIGWKESRHGTFRGAVINGPGDVSPPIIGPPLNGEANKLAISDSDGGVWDDDTTWDRAVGPMQFIPTSWQLYGADGNGDGVADPHNIFDATVAAVAHLCSSSPVDLNASDEALREALFAYNNSTTYVDSVTDRIGLYDAALRTTYDVDPSELLASANFTACDHALADLRSGLIDPRVVSTLTVLTQTYEITACPLRTGHYQCIGGGSRADLPDCIESHHWYGRAVDITHVNGAPATETNTSAREIVESMTTLAVDDPARPYGIGSPWPDFSELPGFFNDQDHEDHLHFGWCGPRWSQGTFDDSCESSIEDVR